MISFCFSIFLHTVTYRLFANQKQTQQDYINPESKQIYYMFHPADYICCSVTVTVALGRTSMARVALRPCPSSTAGSGSSWKFRFRYQGPDSKYIWLEMIGYWVNLNEFTKQLV